MDTSCNMIATFLTLVQILGIWHIPSYSLSSHSGSSYDLMGLARIEIAIARCFKCIGAIVKTRDKLFVVITWMSWTCCQLNAEKVTSSMV